MARPVTRRIETPKAVRLKSAPKRRAGRTVPPDAAGMVSPGFIPLARSLGYHTRELSESWSAAMDAAAQKQGISLTQWRYLRELWESDRLTTGELTSRVGREGPTTVVAVRSLERAGLVRLDKSTRDRRRTYICLTARGRRLAAVMSPAIQEVNDIAVSDLTPGELRTFQKMLIKIQRKLDAHSPSRNSWSIWRTNRLATDVGE
jgi:MarR family transcriptional regulator, transcriptional regulator for hemolysin